MKISDILIEAPLPDKWNKEIFTKETPFDEMVAYALNRASKIGSGSSRVAVIINYKGRDTVLKVAKNIKGLQQNKFEAKMLSDPFVKKLGITIPMIDYDMDNVAPKWIHVEKAEAVTLDGFKHFFGDYPAALFRFISGEFPPSNIYFDFAKTETKSFKSLVKLVKKYDLPTGDFTAIQNWGKYKENLVIIDIGINKEIFDKYYKM